MNKIPTNNERARFAPNGKRNDDDGASLYINTIYDPASRAGFGLSSTNVSAVVSVSAVLGKKFQPPMMKNRVISSYNSNNSKDGEQKSLKTSTFGQKRRFDGMSKLMAHSRKGVGHKKKVHSGVKRGDSTSKENQGVEKNTSHTNNDMRVDGTATVSAAASMELEVDSKGSVETEQELGGDNNVYSRGATPSNNRSKGLPPAREARHIPSADNQVPLPQRPQLSYGKGSTTKSQLNRKLSPSTSTLEAATSTSNTKQERKTTPTLLELQLAVAATQQDITHRKECELLLESIKSKSKSTTIYRSQERKDVIIAQDNQKRSVRKALSLLKKHIIESNKGKIDADSLALLATRCDNELARALWILEYQFTHNNKNSLMTNNQEGYDDPDTMKLKNTFYDPNNQTYTKNKTNRENYVKAMGNLSSSELDNLLMTVQLQETDLGRVIKQSVAGMQIILEKRRTDTNMYYKKRNQNMSETDKQQNRKKRRATRRVVMANKPYFGVLTKAQGVKKARRRLECMTMKVYQQKSTQARDAEVKWDGKRWDFISS